MAKIYSTKKFKLKTSLGLLYWQFCAKVRTIGSLHKKWKWLCKKVTTICRIWILLWSEIFLLKIKLNTQRTLLEFYTDAYDGPKQFRLLCGLLQFYTYAYDGPKQFRLLQGFQNWGRVTFSVIVFVFFFRVLKYFLCFKDSDQFIVTSKRNRNCNFV